MSVVALQSPRSVQPLETQPLGKFRNREEKNLPEIRGVERHQRIQRKISRAVRNIDAVRVLRDGDPVANEVPNELRETTKRDDER